MGGTIQFESEEGVGTTFVIQIPFKIDTETDRMEKEEKNCGISSWIAYFAL